MIRLHVCPDFCSLLELSFGPGSTAFHFEQRDFVAGRLLNGGGRPLREDALFLPFFFSGEC